MSLSWKILMFKFTHIAFSESAAIQDNCTSLNGNIVRHFEEPVKLERGQKSTSTTHTPNHQQSPADPFESLEETKQKPILLPPFVHIRTYVFIYFSPPGVWTGRESSKMPIKQQPSVGKGCETEEEPLKLFFHKAKLSNN